jgi:hypothetical protein
VEQKDEEWGSVEGKKERAGESLICFVSRSLAPLLSYSPTLPLPAFHVERVMLITYL